MLRAAGPCVSTIPVQTSKAQSLAGYRGELLPTDSPSHHHLQHLLVPRCPSSVHRQLATSACNTCFIALYELTHPGAYEKSRKAYQEHHEQGCKANGSPRETQKLTTLHRERTASQLKDPCSPAPQRPLMATKRINSLDRMFDSHPSLSASLESMENRSPVFGLPSQHSGLKLEDSEADVESNSEEPWSPPAWRNQHAAGGWYRHQPYLQQNSKLKPSASPSHSRGTSPQYEDARENEGETIIPANIPLPRGSMSPTKELSPSPQPCAGGAQDFETQDFGQQYAPVEEPTSKAPENANNCVDPFPRLLGTDTDF